MQFNKHPHPEILHSLSNLKLTPFWLDSSLRPEPEHTLTSEIKSDLTVVGGGFTGLWTALLAKEENPNKEVVLIEASEIANGASGRSGGFVSSLLTHSFNNGLSRWPDEMETIVRLGHENLTQIEETIKRYEIKCDYIRSGELRVTSKQHEVELLKKEFEDSNKNGEFVKFYEAEKVKTHVNSPTFLAGLFNPASGLVNPAKLSWGLKKACLALGVKIFEKTVATKLTDEENGVCIKTQYGLIKSKTVALATNAFPSLIKKLSYYIAPVYDYVLVTEPLNKEQKESINWHRRQGVVDVSNQYHYYHYLIDGRILFGGYDAIYHFGSAMGPQFESRPKSFSLLAEHFFQLFPQLKGLKFSHAWGGAIDTCTRFSAFWGSEFDGKVSYVLGYTGLGIGASRFGAKVMLNLLDGKDNELTNLKMVKNKPIPFPPEPLRSLTINATRWSLQNADENFGKRNWWLKLLDFFGVGFNS